MVDELARRRARNEVTDAFAKARSLGIGVSADRESFLLGLQAFMMDAPLTHAEQLDALLSCSLSALIQAGLSDDQIVDGVRTSVDRIRDLLRRVDDEGGRA